MFGRIGLVCSIALVIALLAWANWPVDDLPSGARADRIVVAKSQRTLTLFRAGQPLRVYPVALGRAPVGAKEREGDRKTPEGLYRIVEHKRASAFHRALRVSYPEDRDLARAQRLGVDPGGDIMVHGLHNGLGWIGRLHRNFDWTAGCIAVTDAEIEQIYAAVPDGTPIEIRE